MDLLIGLAFLGFIAAVVLVVALTMVFSRSNLRRHSRRSQRRRRHGALFHRGHGGVTWGADTSYSCSWSGAQGGDGHSGDGHSSSSCSSASCGGGSSCGGGGN
ncbi:hypothetical protein ABTZ46_13385 [Nocardioides sp. NPDC126508]